MKSQISNLPARIASQFNGAGKNQNYKGRIIKIITLLTLYFVLCTLALSPSYTRGEGLSLGQREALAQDMSSQNFMIQQGNFNMTSGNKESANFKLSDVVGQTAAGIFNSKGYIINAGFLNGAAGDTFSFSVDPAIIDFGSLTANTFVDKIVHISVANGNTAGFSIRVVQNNPLATSLSAYIPDTICDNSTSPCTQSQASVWSSNSTYGFGYRVLGNNTPSDFAKDNSFRPFPAISRNEQPTLIMFSQSPKAVEQANMTLRINISNKQPVGQYKNKLHFTALVGI